LKRDDEQIITSYNPPPRVINDDEAINPSSWNPENVSFDETLLITPSKKGTKQKCQGIMEKTGQPCKHNARKDSNFCGYHKYQDPLEPFNSL
jgi:hypothetical protein